MSDTPFDPKTMLETYRGAFVQTLDKVGRYQYAVAGDYLEWSLAQAQLALRAPTPTDFFTQQVELTTALSEKLRVRAQEFATLAQEAQAGAADSLKQAASAAAASTAQAVDAARKFSGNSQAGG